MRSFAVYSRNSLARSFTLKEASEIVFVRNGIRLSFLIDIFGIMVSIHRRLYSVTLLILISIAAFQAVVFFAPQYSYLAYTFKACFNLFLVFFGYEIEEFLLKRKGLKLVGFKVGKNLKDVRFDVESGLKLKLT